MTKACDGEGLVGGHEALRISQTCQCKPTLDASRRHLRFARRNTPKHHVYQTRDQPNILCPTWPFSKTIGKLTSRQTCWRNLVGLKATFVIKSKYTSNSLDGCHDDQQHSITVLYGALGIEFTETSTQRSPSRTASHTLSVVGLLVFFLVGIDLGWLLLTQNVL